ncbi:hypothetical protein BGZ98_005332 [Dissophora globulifera]|nr:hypothetical protein BGZ98_005332 [Dissophora globulifera]
MYQLQADRSLGALAVFASLAGLVIFIFLLYNVYLIATGVTTNENFKWEDIGEMVQRRELVELQEVDAAGNAVGPPMYEQRDRRHPSHPRYVASLPQQQQQQQQQQGKLASQRNKAQIASDKEPALMKEQLITRMKDITNIYDEGVMRNIMSLLFPPSLEAGQSTVGRGRGGQTAMQKRVQKGRRGA